MKVGKYYVFGDKMTSQPVDVGWHLVDGKTDGVHGPVDSRTRTVTATGTDSLFLFAQEVKSVPSFVVLRHRDHNVALGTCGGRPRDLDEKLRVHGRRFCQRENKRKKR